MSTSCWASEEMKQLNRKEKYRPKKNQQLEFKLSCSLQVLCKLNMIFSDKVFSADTSQEHSRLDFFKSYIQIASEYLKKTGICLSLYELSTLCTRMKRKEIFNSVEFITLYFWLNCARWLYVSGTSDLPFLQHFSPINIVSMSEKHSLHL